MTQSPIGSQTQVAYMVPQQFAHFATAALLFNVLEMNLCNTVVAIAGAIYGMSKKHQQLGYENLPKRRQ